MRLIERVIEEDSGDFDVAAPTPALAAGLLLAAHAAARDRASNLVKLPDGQLQHIEPTNVIETAVFCMLLDERGQELEEVEPEWPSSDPHPNPDEAGQDAEGAGGTAPASPSEDAGR